MVEKVEVLIIGAGIIGSSVAMHLARLGMDKILVIDLDLEGTLSSSERNAGGVRATWVEPINIEMSKLSIGYYSEHSEVLGYKPCGYIWLYSQNRIKAALAAMEKQVSYGLPVEIWDAIELQEKIPFLNKTKGISKAIFTPHDGLINPNLLKNHYRDEGRKLGVSFEDQTFLTGAKFRSGKLSQYEIEIKKFKNKIAEESKIKVLCGQLGQIEYENHTLEANVLINCAGPWASQVAQILGYQTPSFAVRRQVSLFDLRELDLSRYGMVVDTSGVYFHPEAGHVLAGFADPKEPRGINYLFEGEKFFQESIWPALYERSTYFERLKYIGGWAGLYEISPDECAILGKANEGNSRMDPRIFEAHSFSGHGVMHSYSAGLLLAEKIVYGKYLTLDASILSANRFVTGKALSENLVI